MKSWIPIAFAAFFFSCQNPAGFQPSSTENPSKAAPDTGVVPAVPVVSVGYSITYSGNGSLYGVAPTDGKVYPEGAQALVSGNSDPKVLAKPGFRFEGWNTRPDGQGTACAPGDPLMMGSGDLALYAVWTSVSVDTFSVWDGTFTSDSSNGTIANWQLFSDSTMSGNWQQINVDPNANQAGASYTLNGTALSGTVMGSLGSGSWSTEYSLVLSGTMGVGTGSGTYSITFTNPGYSSSVGQWSVTKR